MSHSVFLSILIFSPFIGFLINGLRFRSQNAHLSGGIATAAIGASFISAVLLVLDLISMPPDSRVISVSYFDWMTVGAFKVQARFVVDALSAIMILVITGVGSLIHLFSIGYMHHDKGVTKYFAYLNLFIFNMLILVLGDSLLTMFVGWEGVGLCSYLLIGFWFTDKEKATAGMKAFITNRVGDAAFLIGMFILFVSFGTLNFYDLNTLAANVSDHSWLAATTLGTLFLFIGATGKSAQIPLYIWLPDAMAGPTPVSALIHAATMVTAGVYMIVRLSGLYLAAPETMMIIAIVGASTALIAATIGMTQWDIKKVLAYSTVSQLGYMFLAVGVGAFGAAMLHLMTHAFFKALMFLGSGSVIHAMHEEQDIRKMGGLKKYMPITHGTFLMGWLAILGIPPFSGFFSKDEILAMSFHSPYGHPIFWIFGVLGAAVTAFYMTRLMALTFWGKSRVAQNVHPHESPLIMTVPLIVLAILSLVGGWVGIPHIIGAILPGHPENLWAQWLGPVVKSFKMEPMDEAIEWGLMATSLGIVGLSSSFAAFVHLRSIGIAEKFTDAIKPLHQFVYNKYLVDEFYQCVFIGPLVRFSQKLWYHVDVHFIDRITFLVADLVKGMGSLVKSFQNGNLQQYAMYIGLGVVAALSFLLMR